MSVIDSIVTTVNEGGAPVLRGRRRGPHASALHHDWRVVVRGGAVADGANVKFDTLIIPAAAA